MPSIREFITTHYSSDYGLSGFTGGVAVGLCIWLAGWRSQPRNGLHPDVVQLRLLFYAQEQYKQQHALALGKKYEYPVTKVTEVTLAQANDTTTDFSWVGNALVAFIFYFIHYEQDILR